METKAKLRGRDEAGGGRAMTEAERQLGELRVRLRLIIGRWQVEADALELRADSTADPAMARAQAYRKATSVITALLDELEVKR